MVRSSDNTIVPRRRGGYTLIEIMVVISIIVLLAASTLPGVFALFNSGSDSQAYHLLSTMLTTARTEAIQNSTYTLVHVQFGDGATLPENQAKCWAAIFMYDNNTSSPTFQKFRTMTNHHPRAMPGNIAFGRIDGTYVSGGAFSANAATDANFRTFSVIFSPTGAVVTQTNVGNPTFANAAGGDTIWSGAGGSAASRLWQGPPSQAGVTAVTLFDYRLYNALTAANKQTYLNDNGQFIALNIYTGQLLPRK